MNNNLSNPERSFLDSVGTQIKAGDMILLAVSSPSGNSKIRRCYVSKVTDRYIKVSRITDSGNRWSGKYPLYNRYVFNNMYNLGPAINNMSPDDIQLLLTKFLR